ncbi:uncharacterized protein CC84DRAFT_1179681 [Paraphaeosphaeria sporulosa]|uniref:Uncharacterized protein n=1 Tax=Paraphaeosphaeria sporulosa TaxID=1460663 RepID=A0A177C2G8_9PLEO|nr:uncharacterized protein CC84DRAFT_1179681 [Paraphaeosphaeria sporulosa]OAG01636.1 hypothetical protein CC84DRAFT_1179681 [Paraphaeosphaeria sporulosa]
MASKGLEDEDARIGGFHWQQTTTMLASNVWPRSLGVDLEAETGVASGGRGRRASSEVVGDGPELLPLSHQKPAAVDGPLNGCGGVVRMSRDGETERSRGRCRVELSEAGAGCEGSLQREASSGRRTPSSGCASASAPPGPFHAWWLHLSSGRTLSLSSVAVDASRGHDAALGAGRSRSHLAKGGGAPHRTTQNWARHRVPAKPMRRSVENCLFVPKPATFHTLVHTTSPGRR